MALTSSIKRAPKWAWYAAGGVGLGVTAIEVYKRRAVDPVSPADATNDAQVIGSPTGSAAPSPVITPPVIIQPNQDSPDFAGIFGTFADVLTTSIGTIGSLAQGDQGLAGTAIATTGDIARDVIASAGQAPAPAATPIIVQVPTATTPAIIPRVAACPAAYPHRSSRGCFKCERHGTKYTHIYANGTRVGDNATC